MEERAVHQRLHSRQGAKLDVEVVGALQADLSQAAQSLGPEQAQVYGGRERVQGLVGADVGGGFGPADVLLAGLQRQGVAGLPVLIEGLTHQTSWDLTGVSLAAGQEARGRTSEGGGVAEHLHVADRDIRTSRTWRLQDPERRRVDRDHQQGAEAMRGLREQLQILDHSEYVGLLHQHCPDGVPRAFDPWTAGREKSIDGAGGSRAWVQGRSVNREIGAGGVAGHHLSGLRVDAGRDQYPLPPSEAQRHEGGLGQRRWSVIEGRVGYLHARELADAALKLEDVLERALADLRLIRGVGCGELAAARQSTNGGRHEVAVATCSEERLRTRRTVGRGQGFHGLAHLRLA